ncbi:MAG: hypothetical protein ACRD11_11235 [Terriglobia bacterium]
MKDRSERSNPPIHGPRKTGKRAFAEHGLKHHSLVSVDEGYGLWAETHDAGPNPRISARGGVK